MPEKIRIGQIASILESVTGESRFAASPARFSAIVELGSHKFQPAPRDAIWLALFRGNRPSPFQFAKQEHVQAWGAPSVAIDTDDAFNFAALTAFDFDPSALREHMQNALFSA